MRFGVLGPVELRADTGTPLPITRRKQRLLVALLLLQSDRFVPTDELVDQLWETAPPASALANLHSYVASLRRLLEGAEDRLETRDSSYRLRAEAGELDHLRFEQLVSEGRTTLDQGQPELAAQQLSTALGLWRGETVAEGLTLPVALRPNATRLVQLRLEALESSFDARLELGDHRHVEAELALLTSRQPHRERLWAQLMLARYRCGRQSEALAAYQEVRGVLDRDLGIEPGRDLQTLQQRILRGDDELYGDDARARDVMTVTTSDAEHDVEIAHDAPTPQQLPPDVVGFTGRARELVEVTRVAEGSQARTVVVDGMAGVGKTTLVVRAAHQLAESYPDGQLFVDLQGFAPTGRPYEPREALAELLRAIGHDTRALPESLQGRAALWRSSVAHQRLLLVIDNAASAAQVDPLIPAASGCLVLVTSRRQLDLHQAHTLTLDVLPDGDAERLFTDIVGPERLSTGSRPTHGVTEIVNLCGRLPLAIRLAASRMRDRPAWSAADQANRLRNAQPWPADLEAGERTVAVAFRLSYDQLDDDCKVMFRLLGLQPGREIGTAAAAALAEFAPARTDQILQRLVDDHLLEEIAPGRFRLHDLLRAYAAWRAEVDDGEDTRTEATGRLCAWYLCAADAAARLVDSGYHGELSDVPPPAAAPDLTNYEEAMDWFETERHNLTATVAAAAAAGRHRQAYRLVGALYRFLYLRGYNDDFIGTQQTALDSARRLDDPDATARALRNLGTAYGRAGRFADALEHTQRARALWEELGDRHSAADTGTNLGILEWHSGRWQEAENHFRQTLEFRRQHGDARRMGPVLSNLGELLRLMGHLDEARRCLDEALAVYRSLDEQRGEAAALANLGAVETAAGDYGMAEACLDQACRIARLIRHRECEGNALTHRAELKARRGQPAEAIADSRAALTIGREITDTALQAQALNGLGEAFLAVGRHHRALSHHRAVIAAPAGTHDPIELARAHRGTGYALLAAGDSGAGRNRLAQAIEDYDRLGLPEADEIRSRLAASAPVPQPP